MFYFSNFLKVTWHKYIWHKRFALKYSSYAWLAVLDGLKSVEVPAKRNIFINLTCPLFEEENESITHLFFQCDFSFQILRILMPDVETFLLRPTLLQFFNFFYEVHWYKSHDKNFSFSMVCYLVYFIWRERNQRRFSRKQASPITLYRLVISAISFKATR
ncbi:hypothetical protein MA16_Dca000230 [Dendrobium catenatum]|uniref:Reverse transcriptase zinc-binding domain-containing protein n=1 Tax=Dendrobium catenatum TaxID=906689 RepID=A0A2I0WTA6_9ASPA|nr:hypothetical protein MA16_Dca000230 [Dendrobium catenatum]